MNNQKIIELCHQIREHILNSLEYKEYKKYEEICAEKYWNIFEEYHFKQDLYLSTKTERAKKDFVEIKEKLFLIEDIIQYFKYKQIVEEQLGNINFKISQCFPVKINYQNELGIIGGKSCG